ncbi:putative glutaredoxin-like, plant II, Thioredoxin-like superfamily [Helianthus annuus]|nr:putative glutaredoxin-like, plant II, Thioredoxin-like superfamily [Helianthus annuus]
MLDSIRIFSLRARKRRDRVGAVWMPYESRSEAVVEWSRCKPNVFKFEEDQENNVAKELEPIGAEHDGENKQRVQFPAVFIGRRMFGGLDQVMATHISG